jgi:8-oxo-dGTP pyrophosphatase MutT (NUDIX family)
MRLAAYAVCIDDGRVLLAHYRGTHWTLPGGRVEHAETTESVWMPLADVTMEPRAGLVDVGLALARLRPATGHVPAVPSGGLLKH